MEPFPQSDAPPPSPGGRLRPRRRAGAPAGLLGSLAVTAGTFAKFSFVFLAVGGYALLWGWEFAVGLIVLIFIHEMGHFVEASREHLHPQWPVFVPFLGAYVRFTRGNPWQTARVALAGPILGGLGGLGFYVAGRLDGSSLLVALGYFGFVLNLLNLLPVGILDGGAIWRSTRLLWLGGGRRHALVAGTLMAATASFLLVGALVAYVPQHRLS